MEHSFSLFSDIKKNRFSDQEKYISFIFISENNILMSRNQIYDLKKNSFHIKKTRVRNLYTNKSIFYLYR